MKSQKKHAGGGVPRKKGEVGLESLGGAPGGGKEGEGSRLFFTQENLIISLPLALGPFLGLAVVFARLFQFGDPPLAHQLATLPRNYQ